MVHFVQDKGLVPIISKVAQGGLRDLKELDSLFDDMKNGSQFGKLVVDIAKDGRHSKL